MGAARNKETLEWAQNDVFGKAKQTSKSITINDQKVSTSISERLDFLVPAAKIADMATGWLAGQSARDFTPTEGSMMQGFDIEKSEEFKTSKYFCKTHFDMEQIKQEESLYADLPKIYPKSVIRISLCRTAKRNPLIFSIRTRMIVVFLVIGPNIGYACLLFSPGRLALISTRTELSSEISSCWN